jgi:prolyl oligopeptidase
MKIYRLALACLLAVTLGAVAACNRPAAEPPPEAAAKLTYPPALKGTVVDDYFGTKVADPYRWLEGDVFTSPEVKTWVQAQNALTFKYLGAIAERDTLKARITELWNYPKVTMPQWEGGRFFYRRNTGLQKQWVVYARESLAGPETLVLDPNQWPSTDERKIMFSGLAPSPDGTHVAYAQSIGGSDWSTWYVRTLADGKDLSDEIRWVKFSGISWTKDGKGFFYGRYPEPPKDKSALLVAVRDKRIYYHVLGTPQSADKLIYQRPDEPTLFIDAGMDDTGRYVFFVTNKGTSNKNELFVKDLGNPLAPRIDARIVPLYTGHTAGYNPLGVVKDTLYLATDRDAPNQKIVAAPLASPDVKNWKVIVPEGKNAIQSASLIAGKIAVSALEDVITTVTFYNLDGTGATALKTPGLGSVSGPAGRVDRPEVFYSFTSPLYATTVFGYDVASGTSSAFEPPRLTFDPAPYETERAFATSKDGTKVPLFITHRKGMTKDGSNPTMLYGYGGFNIATTPAFRPDIPAWLERGGVWVTASMRGGSEYGETWHEAGMKEKKQSVFDDFIGAAEYLVREKWASPSTLGIMGGSNGGLLVGAVMEQRPDLFAVALPAVGVMDMLRYQEWSGGKAWATEYGASNEDKAAFEYLYRYSPVHNVKAGTCYPATLVTTADSDDRVAPGHSFKFAASVQAAQGCGRPVLIRVETQGSHGVRTTDSQIAELADEWAFALANMKRPRQTP